MRQPRGTCSHRRFEFRAELRAHSVERLVRTRNQRFDLRILGVAGVVTLKRRLHRRFRTARQQAVEVERPARFRPGAGQPFAAERLHADHSADHIAVHIQVADVRAAGHLRDGFIDTCVYAKRQAVTRFIDLLNQPRQVVAVVAHHVQYRAEDLFFHLIKAFQLNQRRHDKRAGLPFTRISAVVARGLEDFAAFGAHRLNMALDTGFGVGVDNRSDVGRQSAWVAHPAFGHRAFQHGQGVIGNLFLEAEHAQRGAALAGAVES